MDNKKHLYWSFQSAQKPNPTEQELKLFQLKYKKDFEKRELYEGDELLDKYRLNSWRNPLFSTVNSLVFAFEHNGELRVKNIFGEEKDILQTFVNMMRNDFKEYQLVHFDAEIVLPYIGVRLNANGFINPPHEDLKYFDKRPWNLTGLDIKQYYRGAGNYSFSIKDVCYVLNIDAEGIIEVEDEFTYHYSGDIKSLEESAIKKVKALSKIHRKLTEKEPLETVIVEEKVENVEPQQPTNWLETLYRENKFSKEIQQGIENLTKKKRLTKKDRENLFTILRGVYIRTNFELNDQDAKKVIEQKETEIQNFIDSL